MSDGKVVPDVYILRASGEGSSDYRVCHDEAAVRRAYVDFVCGINDAKHQYEIDEFMRDFSDPEEWGQGQLEIELYCASVKIWRVPASLFYSAAPVAGVGGELVERLRKGMGSALGRDVQIAALHRLCREAAAALERQGAKGAPYTPEELIDVAKNTFLPRDRAKLDALNGLIHALEKDDVTLVDMTSSGKQALEPAAPPLAQPEAFDNLDKKLRDLADAPQDYERKDVSRLARKAAKFISQFYIVGHVERAPLLDIKWTDIAEALKIPDGTPLYALPPITAEKQS